MSEDKTQPAEAIAELAARLVEQVGGPVHEEILLIAEKVGELSDRFAKIEGEFTAQTAPLDAAKANQDASITALHAAIAGIKALNFHVLDNNLGKVSARLESETAQSRAEAKELDAKIGALKTELTEAATALEQKLSRYESARTELAKKQDDSATQLAVKADRAELQQIVADLTQRLESSRKEFAEPKGFNPRGKYDAQAKYARLDVVTINGTSYISVEDGNTEKPGKASRKWQVLASRGGSAALGGGATDITGVAGVGATGLQLAQAGTEDEARAILGVADVVGATADDDGEAGRVPQPDAGEQGYFLRGDGTWAAASVVTAALATESEARAGADNEKYISPFTGNARALLGDLTRQTSDVLFSDGATSNRRGEATFGTKGAVAGMPISFPFEIDVPTGNPSTTWQIFTYGPSGTGGAALAWSCNVAINTSGALTISQLGATGADYRLGTYAGFRAAFSGQRIRGVVVFESGNSTTNPKAYIAGVDSSSLFTFTTAGTPPNWMPTSLDTTKAVFAAGSPAGRFVPHAPILGALTAAEVLAWTVTGRLPEWCEVGTGSAVNLASATMTNTTGGNAVLTGATSTGFTSFTADAGSFRAVIQNPLFDAVAGRKYRVTFNYTRLGGTATNYVTLATSGFANASVEGSLAVADGANAFVFTANTTGQCRIIFGNTNGAADNYSISGLVTVAQGPLAKWEIQPIATCYDAGDNKIPLLLTSGITPITNRRDWILQGQTNTNGNQQLLGASAFVSPYDYTRMMLDSVEVNGTSTATVGVGSASGGAQYVTAAAIASGRNRRTLVTPIPGTANIWVSSNATDTLKHTIRGHIVD